MKSAKAPLLKACIDSLESGDKKRVEEATKSYHTFMNTFGNRK